jgi:hypothetical protein
MSPLRPERRNHITCAHYVRFLGASLASGLSILLLAVYLSKTGRQLQLVVRERSGKGWHEKDECVFDDVSPNCTALVSGG